MIRGRCASLARIIFVGVLWVASAKGLPSLSTSGPSSASGAVFKFDEYMVEHEVSSLQAKNAALAIDPDSLNTPFGCQKCSTEEIRYCESASFVSDHCCCDRRFHEELPYIPHTCYFGRKLCRPIAGHCDEYTKLRKCCCDKHALKLWKAKSSTKSIIVQPRSETNTILLFSLLVVAFNRSMCKI